MRIAVFGAGAAGGLLAGFLSHAGHEVALIARGERLRAIREHGLAVDSYIKRFQARPAIVTDDPIAVGTVDAIILAVKAWQVLDAAKALGPLIGRGTCILTLQNGVEAPSQVASVCGWEHTLVGVGTFVSEHGDIKMRESRRVRAEESLRAAVKEANDAGMTEEEIGEIVPGLVHELVEDGGTP